QAAADMAALAGVSALLNNDTAAAQSRASQYLDANCVTNTGSPTTSVIEIGKWDEAARAFTVTATKPNAVRVSATRHDAPLFFAAIFNVFHYDMTRSATAMVTRPSPCSVWGIQSANVGG